MPKADNIISKMAKASPTHGTAGKKWEVSLLAGLWPSTFLVSLIATSTNRTRHRRRITGSGKSPDTTPPTVPVRKPAFLSSRETPTLRATWLGHACYLVEFPSGLRVLFDPVFEPRCSPFTWLGPKRYTEVPCEIEDIPTIDAVVISHSHYDHLSRKIPTSKYASWILTVVRSNRKTNPV